MTGEGAQPAAVAAPPGPLATLFQQALPGDQFEIVQTPLDETLVVQRDDFVRVMETARNHASLRFDYLRCLSGVDYITHMEVAYHLHSYSLQQSVGIKVRCPNDDLHVPTVSHIWQAANWHERETHEMFGIVFDGHPDLRPLLTEEGLGYYPLRKSHPLAEIEEWQEDYVEAIARAQVSAQGAAGAAPAVDEKAVKIALAQKKAAAITKARDAARAQGLSPEDEKAAVQAAIKAVEEEEAAAAPAAAAPPQPVDERAARIALAQKKAALITETRDEARARGLSPEDERLVVAEALKKLAEDDAAAPPAAPAPAAAPPAQDRAAKIALAQRKAALITQTRNEARARGLSPEEERQVVAEALKKLAEEERGG